MLRTKELLTVFITLWECGSYSICYGKPFLNMGDNIAANVTDHSNSSLLISPPFLAPEALKSAPTNEPPGPLDAVHQDLHPILLPNPNTSSNGFNLDVHPIATDPQMQIALDKATSTEHPVGGNDTALVHPNATKLEELMDKIKQPIPDPDSPHIQPKGPEAVAMGRELLPSIVGHSNKGMSGRPVEGAGLNPAMMQQAAGRLRPPMNFPRRGPGAGAMGRELLPSIVGNSNKDLSRNPVEGSGLSPATLQQAAGNLPQPVMMPNPFGDQPSHVPVGMPELKAPAVDSRPPPAPIAMA